MATSTILKRGIYQKQLCKYNPTTANNYEQISLSDSINNYDLIGVYMLQYDNMIVSGLYSVADFAARNRSDVAIKAGDGTNYYGVYCTDATHVYGRLSFKEHFYLYIVGFKLV